MPRKLVSRWLPDPQKVRHSRVYKCLGPLAKDPYLFHINRKSISQSFFIGLFCCYLPIPFHSLVAGLWALWWRSNLPLALALIWISNPLTIGPMFYLSYRLGSWILGTELQSTDIVISWEWISSQASHILLPLFTGSLICGLVLGTLGFLIVRIIWRITVLQQWAARAKIRSQRIIDKTIHHKQ